MTLLYGVLYKPWFSDKGNPVTGDSDMAFSNYDALAISFVAFLGWKTYQRFVKHSNIRGPSSASLLTGKHCTDVTTRRLLHLKPGNFFQLFNGDSWAFYDYLNNTFGGLCKLNWIVGVGGSDDLITAKLTPRKTRTRYYMFQILSHYTTSWSRSKTYTKSLTCLFRKFLRVS